MGVLLTRKDVFDLLENPNSKNRLSLATKICQGYNEKAYSWDELQVAEQILRILAQDAETRIRATLSESLKLADDLPHDIALSLAKDIEDVSIPMLEFSNVLTDGDLLEIIYSAGVQKLLAVSRREKINSSLAKALAERSIDEVTFSVLTNENLVNNEAEYEAFIESCADNEVVIGKIVKGITLPVTVSEKLLTEYSSQILNKIKTKYNIVPAKFDRYLSHSLEISTLTVIDHKSSSEEVDHLVMHLSNFGRLTPSIILSAVCMGRRRFFISALARRAGITKANVAILLEKGGREGLYALLQKAGIPNKLFEALEMVLVLMNEKKAKEPEISVSDFCTWLVSKLEYFADKKNVEYLSYMITIAKQSQKPKPIPLF